MRKRMRKREKHINLVLNLTNDVWLKRTLCCSMECFSQSGISHWKSKFCQKLTPKFDWNYCESGSGHIVCLEHFKRRKSHCRNILDAHSISVRTCIFLFLYCCCSYWQSSYRGMLFGPLAQLSQFFARARRFLRRSEGSNNEIWRMRIFWFLTSTSNVFVFVLHLGLFKLMREKNQLVDRPNAIELPPLQHEIEVRNVSFSYNQIPAVKDLTFTLKVCSECEFSFYESVFFKFFFLSFCLFYRQAQRQHW
jgi:ABC-type multidrug transport system fused ATPase/permease subunit